MDICPTCLTVFARSLHAGIVVACPHCGAQWPGAFPPYAPTDLPPVEVIIEPFPDALGEGNQVPRKLTPNASVTLGREQAGDECWTPAGMPADVTWPAGPRLALPDAHRVMSRAHAAITWRTADVDPLAGPASEHHFAGGPVPPAAPTAPATVDPAAPLERPSAMFGQDGAAAGPPVPPGVDDPRTWRFVIRDLGSRNGTWTPVPGDPRIAAGAPWAVPALRAPRIYLGGGPDSGVAVSLRVRVAPGFAAQRPPKPEPADKDARPIPWSRETMPTLGVRVRGTEDALGALTPEKTPTQAEADPLRAAAVAEWRRVDANAGWIRPLSPGPDPVWLNGHRLTGTTAMYVGDRLQHGTRLHEIRTFDLLPVDERRGLTVSVELDRFQFGQRPGTSKNPSDNSKEAHPEMTVAAPVPGQGGLKSIRLTMPSGAFIGILGPSGCGKTTLLSILSARLDAAGADGGARWVRWSDPAVAGDDLLSPVGTDPAAVAAYRARVALVPQDDGLHGALTPREELSFAARLRGWPCSREQLDYLGAQLGLSGADKRAGRFDRRIDRLSGGERKRVNIALGLLGSPGLLLLDEPTAALDPATERRVMAFLRRLADQGHTVVCVTHVLQSAALFDQWVVMRVDRDVSGARWGTVDFVGAPSAVLRRYRAREVGEVYARLETAH